MEEKQKDVLKIIEGIGQFMKNTNGMLASFELKINNLQIDIDKIKKENKKEKNLIFTGRN